MATAIDFRTEIHETRERESAALERRKHAHPLLAPALWGTAALLVAVAVMVLGTIVPGAV